MDAVNISRRRFLKHTAVLGGGIVIGVNLPGCSYNGDLPIEVSDDGYVPNAFLQITPSNEIIFYSPSDEMGQGIRTGLATVIGEELDVHPSRMRVVAAGSHKDYVNPEFGIQGTGGSNAIRVFWEPLRQTGADTRALILAAAAKDLQVSVDQLNTDNGYVIAGKDRYPYGNFVATAGTLPMPEDTPLKDAADFRDVGTNFTRVDALEKSTGTARFGIDAEVDGMVHAVVVRAPVAGARPVSIESRDVEAMPGVVAVTQISSGIAVVAHGYWRAQAAAKKLSVVWSEVPLGSVDSKHVRRDLSAALDADDDVEASADGDIDSGMTSAKKTVEAEYFTPYLAHAPLEPMNATIHIQEDRVDLWTGVQMVQGAQGLIERLTGRKRRDIHVHNLFLGGGFGRRGTITHIAEVTEIAMAVKRPVQLMWSREDDIRNGLYRPASLMRLRAGVDEDGKVTAWEARRAGANITVHTLKNTLPALLPGAPAGVLDSVKGLGEYVLSNWIADSSSVEGLHEDYSFANYRVSHASVDHGLPVTVWRSVGHSYTGFAVESMMDELAEQAGLDPVQFRLINAEGNPRMQRVIRKAGELMAQMSVPEGHHLGFASVGSFFTDVAEIAEVSVTDGKITVHKVTCVVDVGTAVNPDIVKAQIEGSVMFALTAALYGEIDLAAGQVVQSNFHDYPILRMDEAPAVEVVIVDSGTAPTGIGEPGVPPLAPAVANAVYRATGQRLRSLPLRLA